MGSPAQKGSRYYALWAIRLIAGILALLQILGLLPALMWLADANAVTPDVKIKILIKLIALVFFYALYYWAGRAIGKLQDRLSETSSAGSDSQSNGMAVGRRAAQSAAVAIGLSMLALFSYFVWPTPYQYDHIKINGSEYPVRTSRLSGESEILRGLHGWVSVPSMQHSTDSSAGSEAQEMALKRDAEKVSDDAAVRESNKAVIEQWRVEMESKETANSKSSPAVKWEGVEGHSPEAASTERALEIVEKFHPDFDQIRRDPKYAAWLERQDAEVRALAYSDSYEDAIRLIDIYKQDMSK